MSANPLYTALLAAQREFGAVLKNKQNPHLKNYYADLSAVLDAVTDPLATHGLLIVQRFASDQGGPLLITELVHAESGQSISSALPIISKDPTDPQKLGGAITYARRYSLLALLGLAPEDDDGNAAAQPRQQAPRQSPAPRRSEAPAPVQAAQQAPQPAADLFTADQYKRTMARAWEIRRDTNYEQAFGYLREARPSMTADQYEDTKEELKKMKAWTPEGEQ